MKKLPTPIAFEWDKGNFDKNFNRHGVTDKETEEVFNNEPKFIFEDSKHSQKEDRFGLFGNTNLGRKLSIAFTLRRDRVRIITARDMSKKERRAYEQQNKSNTKI